MAVRRPKRRVSAKQKRRAAALKGAATRKRNAAKRRAAALKGAATRKRNAAKRSAAARKAAKTRKVQAERAARVARITARVRAKKANARFDALGKRGIGLTAKKHKGFDPISRRDALEAV